MIGCVRVLTVAILMLATFSGVVGQSKPSFSIPDLNLLRPDLKTDIPSSAGKTVAMDSPVNPDEYILGPSDVVQVNVWSSAPKEHVLTVTPEGSLLVPNAGAVAVGGLTLKEAKARVAERLRGIYSVGEVTTTLISPRKVVVRIVGNVINEGIYEMQAVQRIDRLIMEANNPTQGQMGSKIFEQQLQYVRSNSSERNISLKHRDGSVSRVDLVRYQITGEGIHNPYLQEGDIIFVPERSPLHKSIGLLQGGSRRVTVEYVPGDKLSDLVKLGFGLSALADSSRALLTRLSENGTAMETTRVDIAGILAGRATDMELRPGDRLVIREPVELRRNYIAAVEGEVLRPGQYPITRGKTKLSEVISAAGGFTGNAYLRGATVRRSNQFALYSPEQVEEEQLRSARASISSQDSGYYSVEMALRLKGELVAVDFHRLFVLGDSTHDIFLQPYDKILIPEKQNTVYVFGQVLSPGHVPIVEGKGYKYFIERAGGFTEDARTGDVKIIKGSTRAWLDPGETTIEDGDHIWVPREVHYPFSHYISIYAQVASIIGVVATVALLINTIK